MEKVTGTVIVRVNGRSIRSKEGAKMELGGFEREPIMADGVVIGPVEKPVAAHITATIAHTQSANLTALNELTDGTIVFECDNGVRFSVRGAFSAKPPEITGGQGDVAVEFYGHAAVEQ